MTQSSDLDTANAFVSLPAMVRAYVPVAKRSITPSTKRRTPNTSEWTLVFDTETTVDAAQSLRVGAYQLWKKNGLEEQGFFFEPDMLSPVEIQFLRKYAAERSLPLMTCADFVEKIFFAKGYELRATIVGFNLPFDISRIACRHNSARGKTFGDGGFTFQLSANPKRARIQVKHLNSRAALIQFAQEPRQRTPRGERHRGFRVGIRRGTFVDVKTLANALLSKPHSLASLTEALQTRTRKQSSEEHGHKLTARYLQYLLDDVQATWECYHSLLGKFHRHGFTDLTPNRTLSEASIGKAYLRQMGAKPLVEVQPDLPDQLHGFLLSSYYGGRTETRWRGVIKQIFYCDFLSMYPTVCSLMGLWSFIIAQGVDWSDKTEATQQLLEEVGLEDLRDQTFWACLHTIVEVQPQDDILPLRARYDGVSPTIGLNFVTSEKPLWYTLADLIVSKLRTGKSPKIARAIRFQPRAPQPNLKKIKIGDVIIDPLRDDLFRRLIDLRTDIKAQMKEATGKDKSALDAAQQTLKIIANATSYGIYVEVNVSKLDVKEQRNCFGPGGEGSAVFTDKSEEPGPYFNPLIATLITGGARLMLGIAETLTLDAGLDWAFCDTDSLSIVKPDDVSQADFVERAKAVVDWFGSLNPYEKGGSIFKIEDQNYHLSGNSENQILLPLYCLCLSSKRYALFNLDATRQLIIRKISAHGLGQLMAPYPPEKAAAHIPPPQVSLTEMGVARWQYDLWYKIICAAIDGNHREVDLDYHPALKLPAMIRYGATSPNILRWLKDWNSRFDYSNQVRPFGFLCSLQNEFLANVSSLDNLTQKQRSGLKPIAPFNRDPEKSAGQAFDRTTGARIPKDALKSYATALARFTLSPEAKFLNGEPFDAGRTERRHVHVRSVIHIGKEANKWEEQLHLGEDDETQIEYGCSSGQDIDERLRKQSREMGERNTAMALGISRVTLRKILQNGMKDVSDRIQRRLDRF